MSFWLIFYTLDKFKSFFNNLLKLNLICTRLKNILIDRCFLKNGKSTFSIFLTFNDLINKFKCVIKDLFDILVYPFAIILFTQE